jgi:alkyl hydroperoxide reductase subunit AhpC
MSLHLGDIAPNFQAKTSLGNIDFYEFLGDSWGVLFSHPADFTPVCTTELGKTAALKSDFEKRGVKVLALSIDGVESHCNWIKDINETQNVTVDFPIIAMMIERLQTCMILFILMHLQQQLLDL